MTLPLPSDQAVAAAVQVAANDATQPLSPPVVTLSTPLWERIAASGSATSVSGKVAVSISLPAGHSAQTSSKGQVILPALSCWAVKDDTPTQEERLTLPNDFVRRLGLARSAFKRKRPPTVLIRRHNPLGLSVAYLAANSDSGFELAQASQDAIVQQLEGRILHQGDLVRLELGSAILPIRVVMTEPVLQGRFSAEQTQVLLTIDEEAHYDATANGDITVSSISDLTTTTTSVSELDDDDDESDDISIDERFLAHTVLQDFSPTEPILTHTPHLKSSQSDASLARKQKECHISLLHDHSVLDGAVDQWRQQRQDAGSETEEIDLENVILLSEKDFGGLGAFNGDWAVAEVSPQGNARIIRLFASTDLVSHRTSVRAWLPPVLLQNLHGDGYSPALSSKSKLLIRPLGSVPAPGDQQRSPIVRSCPLPVPFADSLQIARVASAFNVDRAYQGLFLEALRTYFEGQRRICKQGDVIAVAIEAGKARFVKREAEQDAVGDASMEDVHELRLPSAATVQKTAVVHFKISSLSSELIAPSKTGTSPLKHEDEACLALRAQSGALGCVVDPDVTKMVQTGVEKCRVADAAQWLGVVSDSPERPEAGADVDADAELTSGKDVSPLTADGSAYSTLLSLLNAILQPNASKYGLHLSVLLKGARGSGKKTIVRWVARAAGVQLIEIDCFDLVSDTDARTEGILRARFEKAADCAPAILLLRNVDALARKSQALETGQEPAMATVLQSCFDELRQATTPSTGDSQVPMPVAVFGTTSDPDKCPTGVLGCFKHEISFNAPNEAERLQMLQISLRNLALSPDVDLKNLATQTAALVAADLVNLVARAKLASVSRVRKELGESHGEVSDSDLILSGMVLTGSDFEQALNKARSSYSESIGAPKIPNVTWDDVGGLASVKSDILDTIQLPLEHPELFSDGLKKRSGILLYGPPGTGKTLLAKAVATSCSLNFFSVKGPELLNMYIGESEANVRRVFQRARDAKPCVIFFDELDSVAPKRGNQGDSGGVMDRIVSQLLAELDGMAGSSEGTDVFVIGATNRPDLLDPALLRPGRFDRMLYLSVSETHEAQLNILQALTRKFRLDADVGDLSVIAEQCPFNLTGADFYALCSDAMLKAMTRKASEVDERIAELNARPGPYDHPHPLTPQYYLAELAKPEDIEVKVNRRDFETALKELVPSVSEQEMAHYREVQAKFSSPKNEEEKATSASVEELAAKAAAELGYSLSPPQEKLKPSSRSTSPSPSRLPVRKPSGSPLPNGSRSSGINGTASPTTSAEDQTRKAKGKGKARATD